MNTQTKILDQKFVEAGFVKAGGMWGDAQWKLVAPNVIVSIGGEYEWEAANRVSDDNLEGLAAPEAEARRCVLFVYHGPFLPGWAFGECPVDDVDQCKRIVASNVEHALLTAEAIARTGGAVSFDTIADARAFLADHGPF